MIDSVVIHHAAQRRWLRFRDPRQLFSAGRVEEVAPTLRALEEAIHERDLYAAGFIAYEAAPAFDPALPVRQGPGSFPLVWFGLYEQPEPISIPTSMGSSPQHSLTWRTSLTQGAYREAIGRIKEHIARGDTYQVNYSYRMSAAFSGDPWLYFVQLARAQNAQYAAFVNTERFSICSASPELFFTLDGQTLTSRPMKGTAARGMTFDEDVGQAEWLRRSEKNRAENVMIVDMVRNDIGRIARVGSVRAPHLFTIEKYPTVWQMTSTVTGETDAGLCEILEALFPCASITGAPKPRTMQIIAELETTPRRIYTGSIGFVSPEREAQFNVAIRTVLVDKAERRAEYGVGGGILWDSTDAAEFEECQTKARVLTHRMPEFSLLETILWTPDEGYFLLRYHLKRLGQSAQYFDFPVDVRAVQDELLSLTSSFQETAYKVRLLAAKDGSAEYHPEPLRHTAPARRPRVCLAPSPVDVSNPFLYHKTTNRRVYDRALAARPEYDDVLLWNERGEITESCIANVVIDLNGELFTPPVRCGLLGGAFRAYLLDRGEIQERVIPVEEIERSSHVYLVNSVRKQREAFVDPLT